MLPKSLQMQLNACRHLSSMDSGTIHAEKIAIYSESFEIRIFSDTLNSQVESEGRFGMGSQIFRDQSRVNYIERVSSPEQLGDYIKVSNPSIWMCLLSVIVLLAGICVWGIFGRLDTTVGTAVIVRDGGMTCLIKEEKIGSIQPGMTVTVNGEECVLTSIGSEPFAVGEDMDSYVMHVGDLMAGEWVYEAAASTSLPDGIYSGSILIERVSPMSFVVN